MNTELVPSELHAGASWGPHSRARTPETTRGGWWDPSLGRLGIGESTRAPGGAAACYGAVPDSVRSAREFGADNLSAWGLSRLAEDLRLVISELVVGPRPRGHGAATSSAAGGQPS